MKTYHRLTTSIFPVALFLIGTRISVVQKTSVSRAGFVNDTSYFSRHAKNKGKHKGIKQKVRAHKERLRIYFTVITCVIIFSLIAATSYYLVSSFPSQNSAIDETGNNSVNNSGNNTSNNLDNNLNSVALIDALYSTYPNVDFTRSLEKTLTEAGLNVEIYQGEEVTVDFLKNLKRGYKLVIFRMHSALSSSNALSLFTTEPYSDDHWLERNYQLVRKAYVTMDSQPVFSVNWAFVQQLMTGKFNGTLVIAMGCNGACDSLVMAQEFVEQGAIGYIAWNGPVLLSHSDRATLYLIQALYKEKLPLEEAVEKTNNQIGADPSSGAILECYIP